MEQLLFVIADDCRCVVLVAESAELRAVCWLSICDSFVSVSVVSKPEVVLTNVG